MPSLDPSLGPIYTCVCALGRWTGDVSLGYDNCLKKVTKCDQIICIKGECVDSRDGKEVSRTLFDKATPSAISDKFGSITS